MAGITWKLAPYDALTVAELYAVLALRSEVFVLEQACLFQDIDGADELALHVLGWVDAQLVAYARCFPAGVKFAEASIGRVVIRQSVRGGGVGHVLVRRAVAALMQHWGAQPIRIAAQAGLQDFYEQHGFGVCSASYVEDGIAHIDMLRPV
jgi:ElaA protein